MLFRSERYFKVSLKKFADLVSKGSADAHTKYYIACLYALQRDADNAVKYLEESMGHLRALNTVRAGGDPDFDGIREDARFQKLIGK